MPIARADFFLDILNNPDRDKKRAKSKTTEELDVLLEKIARTVQVEGDISASDHRRINSLITENAAIKLSITIKMEGSRFYSFKDGGNIWDVRAGTLVEPVDGNLDEATYIEAIISLLEKCQEGRFELRRCIRCGEWFIPYKRAARSKFCTPKCRNRFHYENRRGDKFSCVICRKDYAVEHFSGLALIDDAGEDFIPSTLVDQNPVCSECALKLAPEWRDYIEEISFGKTIEKPDLV